MVKNNKIKKIIVTVDCRNVFIEKYSREVSITFDLKDNIISIKPGSRKKEVGRFEQITLDDYLHENGDIMTNVVFSKDNDLFRISLDYDTINTLYNENRCITTENLCLAYQWLTKNNKKAFYSLTLCDYDEIPENIQSEYIDYKSYDFIAMPNSLIYPNCDYSVKFET